VLVGGDANAASADSDAAAQTAHRLGPLALAASAARIAAEARIRAAAQEASASAMERPKAAELDEASEASGDSREAAGPDSSDIAAVWGAPGFATRADEEPEVVRFWPWSQPATNAEGDPEPGGPAAEQQDRPQASHPRRNRVARGYTIPRLSRAKRPGAISGP
jgi:hypothetical protein